MYAVYLVYFLGIYYAIYEISAEFWYLAGKGSAKNGLAEVTPFDLLTDNQLTAKCYLFVRPTFTLGISDVPAMSLAISL